MRKLDYSALLKRTEDDSIIRETREHFSNMERLPFRPVGLTGEEASFSLTFALDRERIAAYAENLISPTVTVSPTLVTPVTPDEKVSTIFQTVCFSSRVPASPTRKVQSFSRMHQGHTGAALTGESISNRLMAHRSGLLKGVLLSAQSTVTKRSQTTSENHF